MNSTIDYYNKNARVFVEHTIHADMRVNQERFLAKLAQNAFILDFGCGSGRDTGYFLDRGFQVTAIDGSEELCRLAGEYTGIPVRHMLFQELEETEIYDGIWACASVLHLPMEELKEVLEKMAAAVKSGGIIYISFKYGMFEGERNGRYFTDMTEEKFSGLMSAAGGQADGEASKEAQSKEESTGEESGKEEQSKEGMTGEESSTERRGKEGEEPAKEAQSKEVPFRKRENEGEAAIAQLMIEEQWITSDVRPGREEEKWLNIILRKKQL